MSALDPLTGVRDYVEVVCDTLAIVLEPVLWFVVGYEVTFRLCGHSQAFDWTETSSNFSTYNVLIPMVGPVLSAVCCLICIIWTNSFIIRVVVSTSVLVLSGLAQYVLLKFIGVTPERGQSGYSLLPEDPEAAQRGSEDTMMGSPWYGYIRLILETFSGRPSCAPTGKPNETSTAEPNETGEGSIGKFSRDEVEQVLRDLNVDEKDIKKVTDQTVNEQLHFEELRQFINFGGSEGNTKGAFGFKVIFYNGSEEDMKAAFARFAQARQDEIKRRGVLLKDEQAEIADANGFLEASQKDEETSKLIKHPQSQLERTESEVGPRSSQLGSVASDDTAKKAEWSVPWSKNWEDVFEKEFERAVQYARSPERLTIVDCKGRDLGIMVNDYDKVEFFDIPEPALFPLAIRLRVLFGASLGDSKLMDSSDDTLAELRI